MLWEARPRADRASNWHRSRRGRRSHNTARISSVNACPLALKLNADVAQLGVELERMHAALAADAGLLRAAERGAQVAQEPAVDPADADFDFRGDAVRAREIGGPDGGREAVLRVVGEAHRLLLGGERVHVAAGPENLLAHHRGILRQSGPDGRLDPAALGEFAFHFRDAAAGDHGGALFARALVIGQHLGAMLLADQRPEAGFCILGTAGPEAFGPGFQRSDELVENRPLDVDALGAQAHLAAIGEHRAAHAFDRRVEVAVGEYDARVLAAELERHRAHAVGHRFHDRG